LNTLVNKRKYGKLNSSLLESNVDNEVYGISYTIDLITIDLNILNTSAVAVVVNIALTIGNVDNIPMKDYIEYGVSIPPNGVLIRSDLKCSPGEKIIIHPDNEGVVVRVSGYEGL
jgi:hypothetical protein